MKKLHSIRLSTPTYFRIHYDYLEWTGKAVTDQMSINDSRLDYGPALELHPAHGLSLLCGR